MKAKNPVQPATYAAAGVDMDKGDAFVEFIKSIKSKAILSSLGGFSGGLELDLKAYRHPVLLSTTDGVGTKILVAQKLKKFDTLGMDLVAMNVNDLLACGALPLLFLDYIACGRITDDLLHPLMRGIVAGCEQARCTLAGGETAEMPDVYGEADFDLAGFAVGLVEKEKMLPRLSQIGVGDVVFGLPSSGIHSNGLSLARKAIPAGELKLWEMLLTPTRIYVAEAEILFKSGLVQAAAHITGGGLLGNMCRVIPPGTAIALNHDWPVPEIFSVIEKLGRVRREEMLNVFNLGIGFSLIVKQADADAFRRHARENNIAMHVIGSVVRG